MGTDAAGDKGKALLAFLREVAKLRRKRIPSYSSADKILWFYEVPRDADDCRSVFHSDDPTEFPDLWLEVRKKHPPTQPKPPKIIQDWIRPQDMDQADHQPALRPEITILVEREVPDPDAPAHETRTVIEKVPEVQRLEDHPEVGEAWLEYVVNQWEPWANKMRRWREVQQIYERVDFMRRRIEEAEERYELVLAAGLLQWRDPTGSTVKRHILTAPAEITLDAARGELKVSPAASFERFRIELDMLELQHQPRLQEAGLKECLETLDVQAWDKAKVAEVLRIIANHASPDAQVNENAVEPLERSDETFRVTYAPALVLREWPSPAYEELVKRFLDTFEEAPCSSTTRPWQELILEGQAEPGSPAESPEDDPEPNAMDGRVYFPLAANDEQRQIIERLQKRPYVLVKGPPGTGKSHTIANLICHLLAMGERVLVTAQAPKALAVLREKLPGEIRSLCVTALGSTHEDQRLLEESVRGILARKNSWKGRIWAQEEAKKLEKELSQLEGGCAEVERELRELREAEKYSHTVGRYEGTKAQIARKLEEEAEIYRWFPELKDDGIRCPLETAEISFLAQFHGSLTREQLVELSSAIPDCPLPNPEEFRKAVTSLDDAEQKAETIRRELPGNEPDVLHAVDAVELEHCKAFLKKLDEAAGSSQGLLGNLATEILRDLLAGRAERWRRLATDVKDLAESMKTLHQRLGPTLVELSADNESLSLLEDARQRLSHFQKGGRRGWNFLAPRVVRKTRYVEETTRVDGQRPAKPELLDKLVTFIELKRTVAGFTQIWPVTQATNRLDPRQGASRALDLTWELNRLLALFDEPECGSLHIIPADKRLMLAEVEERRRWSAAIDAEIARRTAIHAREPLEAWLNQLCNFASEKPHQCVTLLVEAIQQRDPEKWKVAWTKWEEIKTRKRDYDRRRSLVGRLEAACPGLEDLLNKNWENQGWKDHLAKLDQAWAWSAARAWLRRVCEPEAYRNLGEQRHRLQEKVEKKVEELAALKAWDAFFSRLDAPTEQNLKAWTNAVKRIGQGTGRFAYRHRRAARQYLMACIPKIPAWIMPLHRLWQYTDPKPGVFDTVIVDEASQAGIESLLLFLLAKRIIVVGDDKQNTPEAVGVPEDDIARLARDHLNEFHFRDEFRPDTSLFDHAERAFGSHISLREHFRCVPEIIRFSNDLCYTDAPLIPLRQPPPHRIPPLRATFVGSGFCKGRDQNICNQIEADAIVDSISKCLRDESYDGKTMGVIVLQGHAQADLIEKKLAECLDPKVREERKLRCGEPARFQGDERDVIFLSLVVAPNHNFRALTGLDYQRRFNVAVSRARDQVWLFHSVQPHDLNGSDLRKKLLLFSRGAGCSPSEEAHEELERLEREARRHPRRLGDQPAPYESWFELDVALEFLRRKYRVRPQYEVAGYRIDLVIEGLDNRLAVECDGEAWHGPEQWEHEMARQRQLERAGLPFVRIRESEYYADRSRAVEQVIEACTQLGIWATDAPEGFLRNSTREEASDSASGVQAIQSDGLEEQETEIPSEIVTAGFGPFSEYSEECQFPDPREGSPASVRAALHQIIEKDGPLPRESVYRLYARGCPGLRRVGKAARQALNRALGTMLRSGEIVQEDELGSGSSDGIVVRLAEMPKVRERPAGERDLLEIPPSELFLVLSRRCMSSPPGAMRSGETLARVVLEHYGFTRLTEKRRLYLEKVIQAWNTRREAADEVTRQKRGSDLPLFAKRSVSLDADPKQHR